MEGNFGRGCGVIWQGWLLGVRAFHRKSQLLFLFLEAGMSKVAQLQEF